MTNALSLVLLKNMVKMFPFGRFMDVNEVPGIFDFLISDDSSYATGAEFTIDGGWTAW